MNRVGQESSACIQKLHAGTKNLTKSQGLIKNTGQSRLLTPLLQLLLATQTPSTNIFSQRRITGEKHQVFGQLLATTLYSKSDFGFLHTLTIHINNELLCLLGLKARIFTGKVKPKKVCCEAWMRKTQSEKHAQETWK